MEIGDWSVARELDVAAAMYVQEELIKREIEREKRDREFWVAAFGGSQDDSIQVEEGSLEDAMSRSALAH